MSKKIFTTDIYNSQSLWRPTVAGFYADIHEVCPYVSAGIVVVVLLSCLYDDKKHGGGKQDTDQDAEDEEEVERNAPFDEQQYKDG